MKFILTPSLAKEFGFVMIQADTPEAPAELIEKQESELVEQWGMEN